MLMINLILIILVVCLYYLYNNNKSLEQFDFEKIPTKYGDFVQDINISPEKGIPKIIHHICPKDKARWHDTWAPCLESWYKYFPEPEYKHMFWYDTELEEIVKSDYPWFLDVFRNYNVNIKRIDMVRPFFLYKYGGIYADMDYMCFKNFYDQLPADKVSTPESPYKENEHIQNALLASPPRHNFWLLIMDEAYKNKDKPHVFNATGPRLYSDVYFKHPKLVNVLPMDIYNPHIADKDAFNSTTIVTKHLLSSVWTKNNK